MDDAVRARNAAREALSDIEPVRLREVLDDRIADASMTPGVLTLLSARALSPDVDLDGLHGCAAGVQLIYEGLRLTRALAHEEPWADVADTETDIDADLDVVAADVLVARGFYLLARTEAGDRAVQVVRSFGRDQTLREAEGADVETLDRNLEADVFELAVLAGTTAVGEDPPDELLSYACELAREYEGDMPPARQALPETTTDHIATLTGGRVPSTTDS
ncbi:hypothetical protein RH858_03620 [Halalkaliarchaeum sp. AArc-GB]|uniref:DUF7114 family protein n=1 Tax=unclassified Halalkaliarchaeum TaxID=2678344 RepID=UPI00217E24E5|nr:MULTISPECIES: hypothetical protein [unclassified Halalkaliarchaeum]MDR5672240.1 hypothetical protein [Halalkaliarchaeum sp. AArc-GB]